MAAGGDLELSFSDGSLFFDIQLYVIGICSGDAAVLTSHTHGRYIRGSRSPRQTGQHTETHNFCRGLRLRNSASAPSDVSEVTPHRLPEARSPASSRSQPSCLLQGTAAEIHGRSVERGQSQLDVLILSAVLLTLSQKERREVSHVFFMLRCSEHF